MKNTQNNLYPIIPNTGFRGNYRLYIAKEREIEISYTIKVTISPADVKQWIAIIPEAPSTTFQSETSTRVLFSNESIQPKRTTENSALHRSILQTQISAVSIIDQEALNIEVIYRTTMFSRQLVTGHTQGEPPKISNEERILFLRPTRTCDFRHVSVQRWILQNDLAKRSDEGVLPFAFRIYQYLQSILTYQAPKCDLFNCSVAVQTKNADCGASNLLFCAIMRHNQIPARVYCGRWALKGRTHLGSETSHCKGEFWVDGIGWVPIDATAPQSGKPRNSAFDFGFDPGHFFATHLETDLLVDPIMYPPCELTWMHQYILANRGQNRDIWKGFRLEEKLTTRHIREYGSTWKAQNAIWRD
jgi:transglutaminase-like putative cysteine protease